MSFIIILSAQVDVHNFIVLIRFNQATLMYKAKFLELKHRIAIFSTGNTATVTV